MIILPECDATLTYWQQVDRLIEPLKKYGITFINFFKISNNGVIFDLNNSPELTEFFYYKSNLYQAYVPLINSILQNNCFVIQETIDDKQQYFDVIREKFDIDNLIFFVTKKHNEAYFWHFGSRAGDKNVINFYLNNAEMLRSFIKYFSSKGKNLIAELEKYYYQLPLQDYSTHNIFNAENGINYSPTHLEPVKKGSKNNLMPTFREMECLRLCTVGNTAEEIALNLNISKRRVHHRNLDSLRS